ncbi:MAG: DDE-type integrase/transposase/recombinase [Opitutaceae bacterium]|jgi:transposase InsO family protein
MLPKEPNEPSSPRSQERWAQLRFSVVGVLLAAPPGRGELKTELQKLAGRRWRHPIRGEWVWFGRSTIERWYYAARREKMDPVKALQRKIRSDHGQQPKVPGAMMEYLRQQYRLHPSWSYRLHVDNLVSAAKREPGLGRCPSYACLVRFMKKHGLMKRPRRGPAHSPGARRAEARFEEREVRSYESEYVNALWHSDFHHGSRRVLLEDGRWAYPILLGTLDDCSRLCCHAQWYLSEGAEEFDHGLSQAFQKRSVPRALMTDNGSAMVAAETQEGLGRLGISWDNTLPFSPFQNGKKEVWWAQVEGRLLPMLEGVSDLTLKQLNEATQAWVEMEYNRKVHSELGESPLERYLRVKDVGRPCPSSEELLLAFTAEVCRTQRRSDGTITIEGVRFEVPSRYGHFAQISVRFASWDLSRVHLCDPKTGQVHCRLFPLDKHKNASGERAARTGPLGLAEPPAAPGGMAPLLQELIARYAATGLPPAYLPKDEVFMPKPNL